LLAAKEMVPGDLKKGMFFLRGRGHVDLLFDGPAGIAWNRLVEKERGRISDQVESIAGCAAFQSH